MATAHSAGRGESGAWRQIARVAETLPGGLPEGFKSGVHIYLDELARWGRVTHLTGYVDPAAQLRHLVLDSLLVLRALPAEATGPLLDIGTGAGAPGLVLKLARPAWPVELVEANRRRANFLRQTLRRVDAQGWTVHQERAEALATRPDFRGRFGIVTLRAVVQPGAAVRLAAPFVAPRGVIVVALGSQGSGGAAGAVRVVRAPGQGSTGPLERRILVVGPAAHGADVPRGTDTE